MMPYSLPEPIRTEPRHFTYLAVAICLLGAAFVTERASYWTGHLQSDIHRASINEPVPLAVGATRFLLPIDYISTAQQRRNSLDPNNRFETLRLSMAWPDLRALTELGDNSAARERAIETIQVELESNPGRESLRARLDPFYRRLARGGELSGPDGLNILTLSAQGALKTDLIVYDPSVKNGFIARCLREKSAGKALCHRAVVLNRGLEVRYSFDQSLLNDWKKLDQAVIQKVEDFRTL
ncbi:hypothetical protein LP7551_00234 [Roseibium album]|nr:hypothetical protein LP7551_00234 [Roseibium album]